MVTKTVTNRKRQLGGHTPALWRTLHSVKDEATEHARIPYLHRLTTLAPRVLSTLAAILIVEETKKAEDALREEARLLQWANRWRLESWVLPYARNTLQMWWRWPRDRRRVWNFNPAGASGEFVPNLGRPVKRPPPVLIPDRHFDWYIQRRTLYPDRNDILLARDAKVEVGTFRRGVRCVHRILTATSRAKHSG